MSGSKPLLALFSLGWREAVGVTAFIIDRAMVRKLLQWIADLLERSHPLHVGSGKLACVGLTGVGAHLPAVHSRPTTNC